MPRLAPVTSATLSFSLTHPPHKGTRPRAAGRPGTFAIIDSWGPGDDYRPAAGRHNGSARGSRATTRDARIGRVASRSLSASSTSSSPAVRRTGARPAPLQRLPERRVLREDIRDRLIEEILGGHLVPGDRLVETRIAQSYGVSQAPVREALRDLELLGFIVSAPFRGSMVREVSTSDLVQIYPIRAVLEGLAAYDAATRIDAAGLKRLENLITSMQKSAARGDTRAAIADDFAFHLTVVEASGNWLLKQFWERMRLATTTFLTVSRSHHPLAEIAERHTPVLEALRARTPEAAERAMRRHIEEPGEWLRQALEEPVPEKVARPAAKPAKQARKTAARPARR
ncbi:MAG: GntR family transcriptional regulator [Acidobacteria bacterium]|nr:GntR family transcriptional regulator [Acidobacteriota bacterium]